VTPSYNQGPFLEETIRSVLLQGYPDLEYIVIDGNSTDESVAIISKYEPWIIYWISEPDAGQTDAINKGIRKTSGDILAWLNSDDVYCPEALREIGKSFMTLPHVDLLYGDCEMIDGSGRVYDRFNVRSGDIIQLLEENFIAQPSAFCTREAWEKAGGLDENLHYAMDYDLWLRVFLGGMTSVHLPAVLSRFRYHAASKSGVKSVQFGRECLDVLDKIGAEPRDRRLLLAILQAYHRTFEAIIVSYEQTIADSRKLRDSVSELLDLWIVHLEKFRSDYRSSPQLLAQSYFDIGSYSCVLGHMNAGRSFFTKALLTNGGLLREALRAWLMTFAGQKPFKRRRRLQAPKVSW
jgi:glycosyltransferase involved in cell wall biosynthesis